MCDLHNSRWTPDHNTIWDFEVMLDEEGMSLFNRHVLGLAETNGFSDTSALCADTTAQEAKIPYPNEVDLMGSLGRSIARSSKILGGAVAEFTRKITGKLHELGKQLCKKNQGDQAQSGGSDVQDFLRTHSGCRRLAAGRAELRFNCGKLLRDMVPRRQPISRWSRYFPGTMAEGQGQAPPVDNGEISTEDPAPFAEQISGQALI